MILNKSKEEWEKNGGILTAQEIYQQPETWKETIDQIENTYEDIHKYIQQIMSRDDYQIILTGAGTSEFIGNALEPHFNTFLNGKVNSYATTDIVSAPKCFFNENRPTLLVSFARSGNSPESVATVQLADQILKENVYHLFITCNIDGGLAKIAENHPRAMSINLSPKTNDKSLAMTSSYTNMMLAGLLIFDPNFTSIKVAMCDVMESVSTFFNKDQPVIDSIIDNCEFNRIIYLGSASLKGTAEETQLKMLELTAGKVTTMYNSSLGFRHGPKSVVNDNTLVICYLSDDEYIRKYDLDIIEELCNSNMKNKVVAIMNKVDEKVVKKVDSYYSFELKEKYDSIILAFAFVVFGQIMALKKSVSLGNKPDTPSPSGQINRVVEGVTIYPYNK